MKAFRTILGLMLVLAAATPAWAFSVRSREFCGTLDVVVLSAREIVVMSESGKRLEAVWTKDTVFFHDEKIAAPSALPAKQRVCVYYRSPWFGRTYVTKVIW